MTQNNINTDIVANVVENQDGTQDVVYQREQSQRFSGEDFVQVYNDTIQNLKNIQNNVEGTQEEIQDVLDEKEDAMAQIHAFEKNQPQEDTQPQINGATLDDLNAFMQLQQKKQQLEQQKAKARNLRSQIHDMKSAAEAVADNPEEELEEIPEKEDAVEKEEVSLQT